ncbi:hypothetical protein bpr_IV177 (plasmid) [Butyrivibrio proteoclasticus B316]|uniref:Isochorismatase-like domain-containing protein n=1 Tax=Butyrivibrio proteoclasticus (strain ATCC 51982 / DSM 14932 / B316) TaxID=515622 RepID=E0S559_BUTPB|nr:isochorismatase family cysteine hydrolase [Butyrivibrio proteoclasticus]ADL36541.1 hypothetical protein bpr_IV177 [Butyrivibrio proteoclasticus B316]
MSLALIVIDIQEKYMDKYDMGLVDRVNARIREAEKSGMEVIYVMNSGKNEHDPEYKLADKLFLVSNCIYEKHFPSAFTSERFVGLLDSKSIREIELIGIDGSSCVAKTALDGVKKGYDVTVNLNCVSSINDKIFNETIKRMAEEGIKIIR